MTKLQALAILGLAVLPPDGKALSIAFAKANRSSAMRLQYEPTHRDQILQEMTLQKEAYDFLLLLVPAPPPQPVPPRPRPVPVPPKPAPPRPRPKPQPRVDWWSVLRSAISVGASGLDALLRFVQMATQTVGVPAWGTAKSVYGSISPTARACIVCTALAIGALWGGWHWFTAGTARIRPLTWPVADVYVDGSYITEGPSPSYTSSPSGVRSVRFVARNGDSHEASLILMPGATYEVRVNIHDHSLEKVRKE